MAQRDRTSIPKKWIWSKSSLEFHTMIPGILSALTTSGVDRDWKGAWAPSCPPKSLMNQESIHRSRGNAPPWEGSTNRKHHPQRAIDPLWYYDLNMEVIWCVVLAVAQPASDLMTPMGMDCGWVFCATHHEANSSKALTLNVMALLDGTPIDSLVGQEEIWPFFRARTRMDESASQLTAKSCVDSPSMIHKARSKESTKESFQKSWPKGLPREQNIVSKVQQSKIKKLISNH